MIYYMSYNNEITNFAVLIDKIFLYVFLVIIYKVIQKQCLMHYMNDALLK